MDLVKKPNIALTAIKAYQEYEIQNLGLNYKFTVCD